MIPQQHRRNADTGHWLCRATCDVCQTRVYIRGDRDEAVQWLVSCPTCHGPLVRVTSGACPAMLAVEK